MICRNFFIYIVLGVSFKDCSGSMMDYIWPKQAQKVNSQYSELDIRTIPFELAERDEKFLQLANELIGLKSSELDKCHNRVIFTLTKSCHTLNSEDLGKLAVMLLNCQSAAEGRHLYPCTENMSLKECTQDMSSDVWNTYHLVTNRAKAVCYRVRQEQFQGLTELTVNKLMDTAHKQLNLMADISANQRRLDKKTHEALQSVHENNLQLLEQQQALANSHAAARATVDSNMRALLNEKALIKSGQAEVMGLVKKLMDKLEMASNQLDEQMEQRAINHKEILNDINIIHENAEDVWLKIEQSTTYLTDQNLLIIKQYEKTLEQLKNINFTINYLGKVLDQTKAEIDKKLSWLNDAFEGTGYTLDCIYLGMLYFFLMMILMIICAFLNLSKNSRFIAVAIVVLNMALENREEKIANILPMDLKELSFTIIFVLFGRSMLIAAVNKYSNRMVKNETKEQSLTNNSFFAGALENQGTNVTHSSSHYKSTDSNKNICNETLPTINEDDRNYFNATSRIFERSECSAETEIAPHFNTSDYSDIMSTPYDFTPPGSRIGYNFSYLRSNTPNSVSGSRKLCDAKTRKGDACKNFAQIGRDFCIRHRIGSSIIGDL